jgi:glycerol-3-phosphate acyltransferase PlsY
VKEAALVLAGYLLGSLPWAYWLPLIVKRVDIRTLGSGNVGASNVWRAFGWKLGLPVLLLDLAKGAGAALLGRLVDDELTGVLAGIAALAGHWRPLFLGFQRGGKVVATTGGVALALAPLPGLCAVGLWILVFLVTRYASIASITAGASLPLFALLFDASWPVVGFTIAAAVAILVLHRANVGRLVRREEPKARLSLGRRAPA